MFSTRPRLSFFACQKSAAGAGQQKIRSGSTLKVSAPGGSSSATLLKCVNFFLSKITSPCLWVAATWFSSSSDVLTVSSRSTSQSSARWCISAAIALFFLKNYLLRFFPSPCVLQYWHDFTEYVVSSLVIFLNPYPHGLSAKVTFASSQAYS